MQVFRGRMLWCVYEAKDAAYFSLTKNETVMHSCATVPTGCIAPISCFHLSIDWLIVCLIDRLIGWLFVCSIDWLIDWLIFVSCFCLMIPSPVLFQRPAILESSSVRRKDCGRTSFWTMTASTASTSRRRCYSCSSRDGARQLGCWDAWKMPRSMSAVSRMTAREGDFSVRHHSNRLGHFRFQ